MVVSLLFWILKPDKGQTKSHCTVLVGRYTRLSHTVSKADCLLSRALLWSTENIRLVYMFIQLKQLVQTVRLMVFYIHFEHWPPKIKGWVEQSLFRCNFGHHSTGMIFWFIYSWGSVFGMCSICFLSALVSGTQISFLALWKLILTIMIYSGWHTAKQTYCPRGSRSTDEWPLSKIKRPGLTDPLFL